ncbi:RagB/SusD family nutrient uptake outer membrane protein [Bacteroides fragilis]|nr:RagB/SusD family nutrient uptake outer membrane protein [Bacteroides fragilis]
MAHFDLVRVYGKTYTAPDAPNSLGIPVVTTVLGSDSKLIRNTVSEVYTQVIKDLKTEASRRYQNLLPRDILIYGQQRLYYQEYT